MMKKVANPLKALHEHYQEAAALGLPDMPFVCEENTMLSLHFEMSSIQSVMRKHDPSYLVLGYTRTMMGFLLFQPAPERIAMIGLGGGSLAKYCAKHLPDAHFTAVEINEKVIALRDKFKIPPDSEKFTVLHANGADYVANRPGEIDVLLVDGFNENGHSEQLCSAGFFDNCRSMLRDGGVLAVNLLANDLALGTYISRLRDSFDDKVLVVDAEECENKVAFAYKGKDFPPTKESLLEKVAALGLQHPIPLQKTAQKIMQRTNRQTAHSGQAAPRDIR